MNSFKKDLLKSLQEKQPRLPAEWYYGEEGDKIYEKIRELPDYPLFRIESNLIKNNSENIVSSFSKDKPIDIVELGSGADSTKISPFLRIARENMKNVSFYPIDISKNALLSLKNQLAKETPQLNVFPINGDYSEAFKIMKNKNSTTVLILIGSNLGNFKNWDEINEFIKTYANKLLKGGLMLLGVDGVQEDIDKMEKAYNDEVTETFNRGILELIRSEIDSNFDPDIFTRHTYYNPWKWVVESVFIPQKNISLKIENTKINFLKGGPIMAERSHKFSNEKLDTIFKNAGFELINKIENNPVEWSYHLNLYRKI